MGQRRAFSDFERGMVAGLQGSWSLGSTEDQAAPLNLAPGTWVSSLYSTPSRASSSQATRAPSQSWEACFQQLGEHLPPRMKAVLKEKEAPTFN